MQEEFLGKKVFITGASRGIGYSIAETFRKAGAEVIAPTRQELDLSSSQSVENYIEKNRELDASVFVFCAGINRCHEIEELNGSVLQEVLQVNLLSSIQILKGYVHFLKQCRYGKIIFITSLYATVTKEGRIPYTSSKHAVTGVMKTLALELAPYNICVDAVAPGYVMTDMTTQNLSEIELEEICEKIPTGRFQETQEIADIVLFLSSEKNKSITGQTINVDGGFLCR